ncbi:unnamed protein product [Arctia plantaginis]|uniref:Uncharacterized protein n=1 Tax=Arctia plantaginis TaxID=874455 RepID=A0A8S0ZT85_ARCPL|nr:unnamed protein product [Arctia plantaginis]CAB3234834.1 unnamed protein product [Arctia plantaginis]
MFMSPSELGGRGVARERVAGGGGGGGARRREHASAARRAHGAGERLGTRGHERPARGASRTGPAAPLRPRRRVSLP